MQGRRKLATDTLLYALDLVRDGVVWRVRALAGLVWRLPADIAFSAREQGDWRQLRQSGGVLKVATLSGPKRWLRLSLGTDGTTVLVLPKDFGSLPDDAARLEAFAATVRADLDRLRGNQGLGRAAGLAVVAEITTAVAAMVPFWAHWPGTLQLFPAGLPQPDWLLAAAAAFGAGQFVSARLRAWVAARVIALARRGIEDKLAAAPD